jgi:formylglycine-generating enzyme required for sulfatase activity
VHCVCPFLKGKKMPRSEFLELSSAGHSAETGLNFKGVTVEQLTAFLIQTCKIRHYKVDDFSIEGGRMLYLASESIGEKAYYLLTALIKEEEFLTQVMLRAASDKPHGLNGFLNETVADLRHVVETVQSAREIGVIKKEQVINIIDSVVERTTFGGGDGGASVNIKGSLVQRTEFKGDEERKRREGERLRKEREEQERRQLEEEERAQREKEEEDRLRMEEEQRRDKQEKYEKFKLKEKREEEERNLREEKERIAEAERKGREEQKKTQEEDPQIKQRQETARIHRKKETERSHINHGEKPSGGKWIFGMIILLAVLAFGWFGTQSSNSPMISNPQKTTPADFTPLADQKTITNSIGMEFVSIPAGEFNMGSPSNEKGRIVNEGPVHHVKISNSFYLGKYEVTQKQWRDIMGNSPSYFKGDNLPVEQVSWNDTQDFIKKLNEKEGVNKYRLPTEAEWEYAARAGTETRYFFGDDESKLGDYAWYDANSGSKTHEVGKKKPNQWNLYDIYGNIWEWVQDPFYTSYEGAPTDGSSWEIGYGANRVKRGCNWEIYTLDCRSAFRGLESINYRGFDVPNGRGKIGFRLLSIS